MRQLPSVLTNVKKTKNDYSQMRILFCFSEKFLGDVITFRSGDNAMSIRSFTLRTTNSICFIEIISPNWFCFQTTNEIKPFLFSLFYLACAMGCLHLIYPMHWQALFLPILPQSMLWTTQCTTPYIIGVHTSLFQQINRNELDDAIIVYIDERKLETEHNDLQLFPKMLSRSMKKGIQQSSQKAGDHLARVFLRGMAYAVGL